MFSIFYGYWFVMRWVSFILVLYFNIFFALKSSRKRPCLILEIIYKVFQVFLGEKSGEISKQR